MSARTRWTGVLAVLTVLTGLTALLTGCAGGHPGAAGDTLLPITVPAQVTVGTATIAGLGPVLVDPSGRTLYVFPPDARTRVTCVGPCAGTWPPLVIANGQRPTAGAGVTASQLGTLPDPNSGQSIVTYAGYPLYRYSGDQRSGTADGQALFLNGGPWYVLAPDGTAVTTSSAPTAGGA